MRVVKRKRGRGGGETEEERSSLGRGVAGSRCRGRQGVSSRSWCAGRGAGGGGRTRRGGGMRAGWKALSW